MSVLLQISAFSADISAAMLPAASPLPRARASGRADHCPVAPTDPASWSSARSEGLYTVGKPCKLYLFRRMVVSDRLQARVTGGAAGKLQVET